VHRRAPWRGSTVARCMSRRGRSGEVLS
jgi:hypothetical protein